MGDVLSTRTVCRLRRVAVACGEVSYDWSLIRQMDRFPLTPSVHQHPKHALLQIKFGIYSPNEFLHRLCESQSNAVSDHKSLKGQKSKLTGRRRMRRNRCTDEQASLNFVLCK